jgi:hypothetical protein
MSREITLPMPDGHTYLIENLDAMQQWAIARRFLNQARKEHEIWEQAEKNASRNPDDGSYQEPSLHGILSAMSDEDSRAVIYMAMNAVKRKADNGGWFPVITKGANMLQFADMKMEALIALTFAVMKDNIDSFFTTEQRDSIASNPA